MPWPAESALTPNTSYHIITIIGQHESQHLFLDSSMLTDVCQPNNVLFKYSQQSSTEYHAVSSVYHSLL